ncbi:SGNH/GDSL hydrolase family protein [Spongiactinospora sp. TRM90649]|uniref:SGNH/GDSL hydrolase family protein n=1 Tax=Spongiactinospora sp. TRM90649 TaxID=3031114 RepID=UPI0023F68EA6|nr:SGNH/GDSL hydrolase family protein [Spongiactinospora sp. TRM90649]MDF5757989.1 GDSL-type esterase/lipase family protein [Spongiactinospora sp. TRM90649]
MVRTSVAALAGAAIVCSAVLVPLPARAAAWRPESIAALGDSISAGLNACGWYVACPSRSWSTGDNATVNSHYLRLRRDVAAISGHNVNLAASGTVSAELAAQAREAVRRDAAYVTILVGAQDACVREERLMTSVAAFRRNIDTALGVLREGLPRARVFVASIPDIKRLWRVGKDNALARTFWSVGKICQSMLAKPQSTAKADQTRRDRVRDRVVAFNRSLSDACTAYGPACRTDDGAVFSYPFTLAQVSKWDYFHPNADGQRVIAAQTASVLRNWDLPVSPLPLDAR